AGRLAVEIPIALREHVVWCMPHRPYCAWQFPGPMNIRSRSKAMHRPYIQLNPPHQTHFLLFDVDTPDAGAAWLDADLPAPTFITQNQENGHAHIVYGLERGSEVCKSNVARWQPMRYAAAIERAYGRALGTDQG